MEQGLQPLQPGELTATAEAVPPYRRTTAAHRGYRLQGDDYTGSRVGRGRARARPRGVGEKGG